MKSYQDIVDRLAIYPKRRLNIRFEDDKAIFYVVLTNCIATCSSKYVVAFNDHYGIRTSIFSPAGMPAPDKKEIRLQVLDLTFPYIRSLVQQFNLMCQCPVYADDIVWNVSQNSWYLFLRSASVSVSFCPYCGQKLIDLNEKHFQHNR